LILSLHDRGSRGRRPTDRCFGAGSFFSRRGAENSGHGLDIGRARQALISKFVKRHTGILLVVGDDRQGIYGFAGAQADALDQLIEELSPFCCSMMSRTLNLLMSDLKANFTRPLPREWIVLLLILRQSV
jgi:hypothetical protein